MAARKWCARSGGVRNKPEVWCVRKEQTKEYADSIPTLCDHFVVLTTGIEYRQPTCPECLEALKK